MQFLSYLIFDRFLLLSFLFSGWWRLACRPLCSCNLRLSTDPIRAAFDACWNRTSAFSLQEPSTNWRKASYFLFRNELLLCIRGSTSQHNLYFYSTLFNVITGTSNRTWTCGPLLRRQLLYPTELLRHIIIDERTTYLFTARWCPYGSSGRLSWHFTLQLRNGIQL